MWFGNRSSRSMFECFGCVHPVFGTGSVGGFRMTRGFYTGLAAVLLLFALTGLWLLSAAQSYRDAADLTRFAALKVSERALDAQAFLSSAVADAQGDAAFSAHGCLPQGGFCNRAQAAVANYSNVSADHLSDGDLRVTVLVAEWVCAPVPPSSGFTDAYSVNVSLDMRLQSGPVRAQRWLNQTDVVQVNSTAAFRSRVNSSGPVGLWDVGVNC